MPTYRQKLKLNNLTKPYIFNNFEANKKSEKRIYQLPIQKLAAEFSGVHENTIVNWKEKDKPFCNQIGIAKSQWALDNVGKVKSKEWLLERVMKDHFAEKKEVEHDVNPTIQAALDRMAEILPKQK